MIRYKIDVRTTGFHVKVMFDNDRKLLQQYFYTLSEYDDRWVPGRGRVRKLKRTFATFNASTKTYGLHRNIYESFMEFLYGSGVLETEVEIHYHHSHEGVAEKFQLMEGMAPRGQQVDIIEFMKEPGDRKILPIQTGFGKTSMVLFFLAMMGKRAFITMGAMHLETWKKDAAKFYKDTSNIAIIRGNAQLKKIIIDAKSGKLNKSIILASVNTIRDFINEYEETGKSTYGCTPIELYKLLGVHYRVTDEVHENLHFNFRHDIETDIPVSIYLSATIESDNPFINKLYGIIYPHDKRYTGLAWKAYTDAIAVGYHLMNPETVKCSGGNGMYSHIAYEQWLMADSRRLQTYYELVGAILKSGFADVHQSGMKCLIIFSSVEMCKSASLWLSQIFPQFTHTSYNSMDGDEVLHGFDVVCSTLGSTGTGKNIYGLRTVILTTGLSNREKNIQVLGRLRDLEEMFPGVSPTFYYLVCKDIRSNYMYHLNKVRLFHGKVKSLKTINTNFLV